jgi:hypothetical protein
MNAELCHQNGYYPLGIDKVIIGFLVTLRILYKKCCVGCENLGKVFTDPAVFPWKEIEATLLTWLVLPSSRSAQSHVEAKPVSFWLRRLHHGYCQDPRC